jgi:hypothetical protein
MELQSASEHAMIESPGVAEASHPHGGTWVSVLDHVIITVLFFAATYSFVYGNGRIRLIVLIASLAIGIFRPHLLIFSLSMASSIDVDQNNIFSPMRVVVMFIGIALLLKIKTISYRITLHYLICLAYCSTFALWCLLCTLIRLDAGGMFGVVTIFSYAVMCFLLIIIVNAKYSLPTYIWLGLAPAVIASILATLHLRVVQPYEYLITPEGIRYRGIVYDPNYLSSIILVGFITCIIYLCTAKGMLTKVLYFFISSSFFIALWVPQSRGGIYSACICIVLFILIQVRSDLKQVRFGNLLLIPFVGVLIVIFLMNSTQSRVFSVVRREGVTVIRGYTEEALTNIMEHPVFGPGEASFIELHGVAPHNTLISIGLEYGIVGMLLMLVGIFYAFFNLWRYRKKGSIIYFFPFLGLNIVLCSFSSPGHKLLWFYLVAAAIFHERVLCNDQTNLATCSQ